MIWQLYFIHIGVKDEDENIDLLKNDNKIETNTLLVIKLISLVLERGNEHYWSITSKKDVMNKKIILFFQLVLILIFFFIQLLINICQKKIKKLF